ncbi:MAG: ABC transporter permease [Candidatus Latescibacterota bacterium]|jgi:ABC-type Na+ efflux pump permease subunit
MDRAFHVAVREFRVTVATKGFIIGILFTPLILGVAVLVLPRLINEAPPKVQGEIAVADRTGQITAGLREYLRPERMAERREQGRQRLAEVTPLAAAPGTGDREPGSAAVQQALDRALGEVPQLEVVELGPTVDLDQTKAPLLAAAPEPGKGTGGRLALVIVQPDAVVRQAGRDRFGSYELFVRDRLDDRLADEIQNGLREAIINARIRASGLERGQVEALVQVDRARARVVTAQGERAANPVFNMLVPGGFMMLLMLSVMTSGQYLLANTIEEKTSRVVEVLLSAVSAMELMAGKILGQMAVGLVVMGLYTGLGVAALSSFALFGLLDVKLIFYLVVFFLLAYLTVGSLMAAIGSAINDLREAQSAMMPLMMVILLPMMLWMPISRNPNSLLAVVLSFVPPLGNFVMLLRLSTSSPPPVWQTILSILANAAGVYLSLFLASKVFRIGLLIYGKPPSLATLWRWVRMPQ